MTDRLTDLAADHEALHGFLEREYGRELTAAEIEELAEDVVEMNSTPVCAE